MLWYYTADSLIESALAIKHFFCFNIYPTPKSLRNKSWLGSWERCWVVLELPHSLQKPVPKKARDGLQIIVLHHSLLALKVLSGWICLCVCIRIDSSLRRSKEHGLQLHQEKGTYRIGKGPVRRFKCSCSFKEVVSVNWYKVNHERPFSRNANNTQSIARVSPVVEASTAYCCSYSIAHLPLPQGQGVTKWDLNVHCGCLGHSLFINWLDTNINCVLFLFLKTW